MQTHNFGPDHPVLDVVVHSKQVHRGMARRGCGFNSAGGRLWCTPSAALGRVARMAQASRLAPGYALVPAGPGDAEFLYRVYASTRADEMALAARLAPDQWGPAQQESFLRMQSQAQASSYGLQFPGAEWLLILVEGRPAGRLILDRPPDEVHLIDIALLPDFRGRGVGSALLGALQGEAAARGVPVRLFVEAWNPARRLYERLGFSVLRAEGLYLEMAWRPGPPA